MEVADITAFFELKGRFVTATPITTGHINSTYKVQTTQANYILQKINSEIFQDIEALTSNVLRITKHLAQKASETSNFTLRALLTKDQLGYHKTADGSYWRMFDYLNNSVSYEVLEHREQAQILGKAFATYQKQLLDLPAPQLQETLKDFHNTPLRTTQLREAIQYDLSGRKRFAQNEIHALLKLAPEMEIISSWGAKNKIPLRSIHQDAKLSNILFHNATAEYCIIDLDTTMPGYLCYDFGDAVRTGMNTAAEDEQNLTVVALDLALFKEFTHGYASVAKDFITKNEIDSLLLGVKTITYEQAIRFLTDFLNGDRYYRVDYAEHNLVRTRVQLKFLQIILHRYDELASVIQQAFYK